jgi:hypothetical protein
VESGGVAMIPKFLFAENCPFIKEMYINDLGVQEDVAKINNFYPATNPDTIFFSNSAGDAFTAVVRKEETANGISPIRRYTDENIILGYIVVDWSYINEGWPYNQNLINNIARIIDYSPSIKEFYLSEQVEKNSPVQELGYDEEKNVSQKVITEFLQCVSVSALKLLIFRKVTQLILLQFWTKMNIWAQ